MPDNATEREADVADPEGVQLVIMMGDSTGSGVSQLVETCRYKLIYRRAVYRMYMKSDREILAVPSVRPRLISCPYPMF